MTGPESSWWRDLLRNPEWWVQNIVVAVIVGVVVSVASIFGQYWVDNRRYAREDQLAERQARHDEQMQNLQFVRSGSSADPDQDRPYATFDLQGQNLAELQLAGADFAYANLSHSDLSRAELSMADFDRADLTGANLTRTNLTGATFSVDEYLDDPNQPGAKLDRANLKGANLTGADLNKTSLTDIYYDASTIWPTGFRPPPSRATP